MSKKKLHHKTMRSLTGKIKFDDWNYLDKWGKRKDEFIEFIRTVFRVTLLCVFWISVMIGLSIGIYYINNVGYIIVILIIALLIFA